MPYVYARIEVTLAAFCGVGPATRRTCCRSQRRLAESPLVTLRPGGTFGLHSHGVGLESSVFTNLIVSLLFYDLIKTTVWKMQFGSEELDLDENGLPVIDSSAKLKVGAS